MFTVPSDCESEQPSAMRDPGARMHGSALRSLPQCPHGRWKTLSIQHMLLVSGIW